MSQGNILFLTILFGCEYGLKQLFEAYPRFIRSHPARVYVIYRVAYIAVVVALIRLLLTGNYSLPQWLLVAVGAMVIGVTELCLTLLGKKLEMRTGQPHKWIFFVQMILLLIFGLSFDFELSEISLMIGSKMPQQAGVYGICIFILLAHSANYAIRWLINKRCDYTFPECVFAECRNWLSFKVNLTDVWDKEFGQDDGKCAEDHDIAYDEAAAAGNKSERAECAGEVSETLRAGRTIGIIERWLWLIFILLRQPSLIGFVLTAKSIVRFKKMDDPEFAEYYLLGTLYSALLTFALSFFIPGIWG